MTVTGRRIGSWCKTSRSIASRSDPRCGFASMPCPCRRLSYTHSRGRIGTRRNSRGAVGSRSHSRRCIGNADTGKRILFFGNTGGAVGSRSDTGSTDTPFRHSPCGIAYDRSSCRPVHVGNGITRKHYPPAGNEGRIGQSAPCRSTKDNSSRTCRGKAVGMECRPTEDNPPCRCRGKGQNASPSSPEQDASACGHRIGENVSSRSREDDAPRTPRGEGEDVGCFPTEYHSPRSRGGKGKALPPCSRKDNSP